MLCYYGSEILKTVNKYLLRFGGCFFVGKQLVLQILAGNRVSLLSCCSAVLCQALRQYTGCIFSRILHFQLNTTVLCYLKRSVIYSVNEPQCDVSNIKGIYMHSVRRSTLQPLKYGFTGK